MLEVFQSCFVKFRDVRIIFIFYLRKFSHSILTLSFTLKLTETSARTREGCFSPILGLATSTIENVVIGKAILAQPPNSTCPSSEDQGLSLEIRKSLNFVTGGGIFYGQFCGQFRGHFQWQFCDYFWENVKENLVDNLKVNFRDIFRNNLMKYRNSRTILGFNFVDNF